MSAARNPLIKHHRRLGALAAELERLRKTLPRRERVLVGFAQAVRVAAAASLGYFGALRLGLQPGFWAAITAISVTQSSFAEVRNSSRDQFIGAIFGGLIGIGAALLGHDHYWAYIVAVMLGTMFCWACNLSAAGRISGITTTIIMLVPHQGSFLQFALFRLGEVTLGALAALLVTLLYEALERHLFPDASS
jgi:uncharacterized membrane protein YgaE (UPF0421/DUF939 family)